METLKQQLSFLMQWVDSLPNWILILIAVIIIALICFINLLFFGINSIAQAADNWKQARLQDREEYKNWQRQWDYQHGLETKN